MKLGCHHQKNNDVWILDGNTEEVSRRHYGRCSEEIWLPFVNNEDVDDVDKTEERVVVPQAAAVQETWRWCQDFVVPLNLCPWASASINTANAIQFFVIPPQPFLSSSSSSTTTTTTLYSSSSSVVSKERLVAITEDVAKKFVSFINNKQRTDQEEGDLKKVAIFFLILPTKKKRDNNTNEYWYNDFSSFYDWFLQLEDDWIDQGFINNNSDDNDDNDDDNDIENKTIYNIYNLVTLAAFHPDWEYQNKDDDDDAEDGNGLDYEKKSPYPTLTFVWSDTIDMAGPEATERIALHNSQVLGEEMDLRQVQALYDRTVWLKGDGQAEER